MSFMHIMPLVLMFIFSFMGMLITIVDTFSSPPPMMSKWCRLTIALVFSFLGIWLLGTTSRPNRIASTEIFTPKEVAVGNGSTIRVITIVQPNGEVKIVNLNAILQCQIPPEAKIMRKIYETGPYCGISYSGIRRDDKFEIVPP